MIRYRLAAALGLAVCLAACGGGEEGYSDAAGLRSTLVAPSSASFEATTADFFQAVRYVGFTVENPARDGLWVYAEAVGSAVDFVGFDFSSGMPRLQLYFRSPASLGEGLHTDSVTLHVCLDDQCAREIIGSPATIEVTLEVTGSGDPDGEPEEPAPVDPKTLIPVLPVAERQRLAHDVIDAEYSAALDRIVMVSASPQPALYAYDPATGAEQSVALDKAPAAVSLSPDGREAAVAHDAMLTHVDLTRLGDPLVSPKTTRAVAANLGDIVLAGNGYAYGFPRSDSNAYSIRSVHIASGTESATSGYGIYPGTRARLHPSGTRMYGADNGVSPADIERYDIASGPAVYEYDSPYHGDHPMCGNLWMRQDGTQIYTACGSVFRAASARTSDMLYAGSLPLRQEQYARWRVRSLSQNETTSEVALLEENDYDCQYKPSACFTGVTFYDSDYLTLIERYRLAPVTVAAQDYVQRGLFVFHGAEGGKRYVISRLVSMPDPAYEYYVSLVDFTPAAPAPGAPSAPPVPVVNASSEAGIPEAPLTALRALPHDVVDAEYSPMLEAVVAVSTFPRNALQVIDVATGLTKSFALTRVPTSVSVGPDGLHAAVGHDGAITLVDLAQDPASAAPVTWPATAPVLDVVLAGNGYAHGFPSRDQWSSIHSVALATGVETRTTRYIYAGTLARLHPSGTKMYGAGIGSRLERYDIDSGPAQLGPYKSESYSACGNLWFSENGATIYTACGNTFKASDVPEQDRSYAGAATLSQGSQSYDRYSIVWASQSAETQELALIEASYECAPYGDPDACHSHVAYYDNFLNRTARYSLSPWTLEDTTHEVRGLFIFHSANGSQRHLLVRLEDAADPYAEFWLARVP